MKKYATLLILLLVIGAIIGCSASTPTASSSSNPLLNASLVTKPVLSGSGANIGTCAYVKLDKSVLSNMTLDQYKEFLNQRVSTKYNWVSIIFSDNTGIIFLGGDSANANYGLLENDGSLKTLYGAISLSPLKYRSATGMDKYTPNLPWLK